MDNIKITPRRIKITPKNILRLIFKSRVDFYICKGNFLVFMIKILSYLLFYLFFFRKILFLTPIIKSSEKNIYFVTRTRVLVDGDRYLLEHFFRFAPVQAHGAHVHREQVRVRAVGDYLVTTLD